MHSTFLRGFADEVVKLASAGETVKRKAKGAAKGAIIGAGTAISFPTLLAALASARGKRLRNAKEALNMMLGRKPKPPKVGRFARVTKHEVSTVPKRITQAAALTGAGLGGLLS